MKRRGNPPLYKTMYIYKITNKVNNKVYIGQTTRSVQYRWKQHIRDIKKYNYPLYRAMKKYGVGNFTIKKIDTSDNRKDLNKKEKYYIELYSSLCSQNGYNVLLGGNSPMPKQVRDKIGIKSKKKWGDPKYRELISEKTRESQLIRYREPFRVYKSINNGSLEKGEFIGIWENQKKCSEELQIPSSYISRVLGGRLTQSQGYIFEYINPESRKEAKNLLLKNRRYRGKKFEVYKAYKKGSNIRGKFLGIWNSQKDCAKYLQINPSNIHPCLVGKVKQCKGYIFKYV